MLAESSLFPNSVKSSLLKGASKNWHYLTIIAVIAVSAGLCLPRGGPEAAANNVKIAEPERADKADLSYTPPAMPETPSARSMLIRLALGTVLVLGLCVATLWIGKRWFQVAPESKPGSKMQLVETLALGRQCALHLVIVGGRQVLVGVDGGGIKSLVPMPADFEQSLTDLQVGETNPVVPEADTIPGPMKQAA
jgi:flagellar biogenesis protein FliO